jgi:hypothetical protein
LGASQSKPMQLCQDPSPAAWTRIVWAFPHDTLSVLGYNIKKCGFRLPLLTIASQFIVHRHPW